jgi:hypothetical protein
MWIKTHEGYLMNLAYTARLGVSKEELSAFGQPPAYEAWAEWGIPGRTPTVMFKGTREECEAFLDRIAANLGAMP